MKKLRIREGGYYNLKAKVIELLNHGYTIDVCEDPYDEACITVSKRIDLFSIPNNKRARAFMVDKKGKWVAFYIVKKRKK